MKAKYYAAWTPKKISDFVTESAVENGGKIIKAFDKQCDAILYADSLNIGGSGHYCVMVEDN